MSIRDGIDHPEKFGITLSVSVIPWFVVVLNIKYKSYFVMIKFVGFIPVH